MTIEPLRMSFVVDCPVDHAYETWTTNTASWWPASHTMSGDPNPTVIIEAEPGGRIFERTSEGAEVVFGEVLALSRPTQFVYLWHMRAPRQDATEVEITFSPRDDGTTLVEIEHRGWERLGERGPAWRDRNRAGWDGLLPHFVTACANR